MRIAQQAQRNTVLLPLQLPLREEKQDTKQFMENAVYFTKSLIDFKKGINSNCELLSKGIEEQQPVTSSSSLKSSIYFFQVSLC